MTNLLDRLGDGDPAIAIGTTLLVLGFALAAETGRRRLVFWLATRRADRQARVRLTEAATLAARANRRRDAFTRQAEATARRNGALADRALEAIAWPTVGDLATATKSDSTDVLPAVVVPFQRAPQVPVAHPVREATSA